MLSVGSSDTAEVVPSDFKVEGQVVLILCGLIGSGKVSHNFYTSICDYLTHLFLFCTVNVRREFAVPLSPVSPM